MRRCVGGGRECDRGDMEGVGGEEGGVCVVGGGDDASCRESTVTHPELPRAL